MIDQIAKIRDIAQDVYETLGSGFSEDVYDRAMQVGLRLDNIGYEGQKVIATTPMPPLSPITAMRSKNVGWHLLHPERNLAVTRRFRVLLHVNVNVEGE